MTSPPWQLTKCASPMIPGKDLILAGMVSLVLHVLAILLVLMVVNLYSIPGKMEKSAGMNICFVNLSSYPVSHVRHSGDRAKKPETASSGKEESGTPTSKIQEKRRDASFPHDTDAITGQRTNTDPQIITSVAPHPQNNRNEMALHMPTGVSSAGTATGTSSKSSESGIVSSGSSFQGGGRQEESSRTLHSAVSRYRQTPPPIYPLTARQKGYEGLVLISVEILDNGSTGQLLVKKSSGYAVLDQAALQAVKKWKFIPAVKNNVKIRTWGDIPIRFVLQESD